MENQKYINIIYFDSIEDPRETFQNLKAFKKRINGAFIFCRTFERFRDLMEEIQNKSRTNSTKNILFHLIVSGSNSENALETINKYGVKQNIKKICIYCGDTNKYIDKYKNNDYIEKSNITKKRLNVFKFIENNKSEEIMSLKDEFNEEGNDDEQYLTNLLNPMNINQNADEDGSTFYDSSSLSSSNNWNFTE